MRSLAIALLLALPATAAAQHDDLRNLDHGRPVTTEDAFPIEAGALESMFPATLSRSGGESDWMLEPELMWGAFDNGMVGVAAPTALGDDGGLAGLRPFAFYTLSSGSRAMPAFALRLDAALPIGALAGDGVVAGVTALLTRAFGPARLHLNIGAGIGSAADAPLDDAPPRWKVSFGIDQVLIADRAVLVADVVLAEPLGGGNKEWLAGAGVRTQLGAGMLFDAGVARRLSANGPDLFLTAGITRSFGGH